MALTCVSCVTNRYSVYPLTVLSYGKQGNNNEELTEVTEWIKKGNEEMGVFRKGNRDHAGEGSFYKVLRAEDRR